ncbi:hypothetical protein TNCV_598541 [Trichonephila clavipes]|nr:hypothetical protein TNCV_598541 [Trichonephila clavipes]
MIPARINVQSSRHCWRSPLLHASALIQRDFGCVIEVQQTRQLPHVAKVDLLEREMKWGRRMDMVDAWSPAEDSDLKVWDLLSLCLSVSESGTSAELPHEVHCTFGSAGNLMTHLAIYGYSDPPGVGAFSHPCRGIQPLSDGKRKRIPPNCVRKFEVLLNIPE